MTGVACAPHPPQVKHKRGILSMGRYDDPNSATSSFSILLGDAPHLDEKARAAALVPPATAAPPGWERRGRPRGSSMRASRAVSCLPPQYCVFGKLTAGWDVLSKMEEARLKQLQRAPRDAGGGGHRG